MEWVLQTWDDVDDLVCAIGLVAERIRTLALFSIYSLVIALFELGAILLALTKPPLALAMATMLAVLLMYRRATQPPPDTISP